MHILDLIMYFVLSVIYWLLCPEEFKYEMGILAGLIGHIIFTVIYVILFVFFYNWIDIFQHIQHVTLPSITW